MDSSESIKTEKCYFHAASKAVNEVIYHGYFTDAPHVKSYRGIIGLSVANFDVLEEETFIPRGLLATIIHMATAVIKVAIFLLIILTVDLHLFWASVIAFCVSILSSQVIHVLSSVKPRNLYLFNLSSLADLAIFLIAPVLVQLFIPEYLVWAVAFSFFILLFVNNYTWSLKNYSWYSYPEDLYSKYKEGYKHGYHPQFDNYFGYLIKPLRWVY